MEETYVKTESWLNDTLQQELNHDKVNWKLYSRRIRILTAAMRIYITVSNKKINHNSKYK